MSQGQITVIGENVQYLWQILVDKTPNSPYLGPSPMPWHCPFEHETTL